MALPTHPPDDSISSVIHPKLPRKYPPLVAQAMAAPKGSVPVSRLREAVATGVAASSLRRTAAEVGVTHKALKAFLEGSRPHPSTIHKLQCWYEEVFAPELNRAAESLWTLLEPIPVQSRDAAMERAIAFLGELYEDFGAETPASLLRLRPQEPARPDGEGNHTRR